MFLKSSKLPKPVKFILLTLILTAVYLIIAVPFKVMSVIPGFTDIRPVMLFKPVFGVFFGIPGCLAFAVGNLIGDIISDSLRWTSIAGFAANFLAPFVFYLFFVKISKSEFSLKNGFDLLKNFAVTLISSVIEAILIAPAVKLLYPEVDFWLLGFTILLNGTAFPLLLGVPLMILMQDELGFIPLKREKPVYFSD